MLPTVPLFGFSVQSMWLMCLAGAGVCCAFVLPRSMGILMHKRQF